MDRRPITRTALAMVVLAWAVTRAWMVLQPFVEPGAVVDLQDVALFARWTDEIVASGSLPADPSWQYPPGAVWLFVAPAWIPLDHGVVLVALLVLCDAAIAAMLLAHDAGRVPIGAWTWVGALPFLVTLPVLRFDVLPTVLAVAALLAIRSGRHPVLVGVLVGIGAAVKAWPVLVLLAIVRVRGLVSAVVAAAVVVAASALSVQLAFGDAWTFLEHQGGRGLQIESVAATPWYAAHALLGVPVDWVGRNGSFEVDGAVPAIVAVVCRVLLVVAGIACGLVWLLAATARSIAPRDRTRLGIDLAFVAVLLVVVVSPLLSPQFLIWVVGVAAVVVSTPGTRMARPVLLALAAVVATTALLWTWEGLLGDGRLTSAVLVVRNVLLVVAVTDAVRRLLPDVARLLRARRPPLALAEAIDTVPRPQDGIAPVRSRFAPPEREDVEAAPAVAAPGLARTWQDRDAGL